MILLYLLIFALPTANRITFLKISLLPKKEQELKEMEILKEEYLNRRKEYSSLENMSEEGESIFSLVERIAKARGLAGKISSIKPVLLSGAVRADLSDGREGFQEVGVEVKMKALSLQNIVNYLFTLENPPYNLRIKEIQVNSPKDRLSLELAFTASRWEKR